MHVPKIFAVDDINRLHDFVAVRSFAMIVAAWDDKPVVGYAPLVLERATGARGTVLFHLAKGNPLCALLRQGAHVVISVAGPDAYVSPDWYLSDDMVPTWNYVVVEIEGRAQLLGNDALVRLIDDLTAEHEQRLLPKQPWTRAKMTPGRAEAMCQMIDGFTVAIDDIHGKWKLSQNRNAGDKAGVIAGLAARDDAASVAVARLMREG